MKISKLLWGLIAFSTLTFAQAQYSIGFQGGYTKASENYGDVVIPDNASTHVNGFMAGVIIRKQFGKTFIDFEPQYKKRGAACVPNFDIFVGEEEFHLEYLEIPIVLGFKAIQIKNLDISARLGYSLAVFLGGTNLTIRNVGNEEVIESKKVNKSNFNTIDHTLLIGIQTGYALNNRSTILASVTHARGQNDTSLWTTSKHRALDITIGALYRL